MSPDLVDQADLSGRTALHLIGDPLDPCYTSLAAAGADVTASRGSDDDADSADEPN